MSSTIQRSYRQDARASKVATTRRRIVEAASELHASVGPARTSLTGVADAAGVSRPTLYSHFAKESELIQASITHWLSTDPLPDPLTWLDIVDPRDRVEWALGELYAHFERNEQIMANVLRDMYLVPSMLELQAPLLEEKFATMVEILASGFDDQLESIADRRRAATAVAVRFDCWQTVARGQGLDREGSVDLITDMVVRSP